MNLLPHLATANINPSSGQPDEVKTFLGNMPNFNSKEVKEQFNSLTANQVSH